MKVTANNMNTQTGTQIRAQREPFLGNMITLRIAKIWFENGNKRVAIAEPIQIRVLTEKELGIEMPPSLEISPEEGQQFMDELWRVGIRPTEGAGSVGQLGAITRHLEDMRSLVFKKKHAT